MNLVIASPHQIRADLRRNKRPILFVFAMLILYVLLSGIAYSLTEQNSYMHSLYFTIINVTTVGFGDIYPITHLGKVIAACNSFAGLIIFGALVATITMALQPSEYSGNLTLPKKLDNQEAAESQEKYIPHIDFFDGLDRFFLGIEDLAKRGRLEHRDSNEPDAYPSSEGIYVVSFHDHGKDLRSRHIHIRVDVRKDI